MERRIEDERTRVEAEYRSVLKSSIEFEKRIRDRWRQKCRAKNERIAELEARVAELESRSGETTVGNLADRKTDGHRPATPS
jgi:hypothetical protein